MSPCLDTFRQEVRDFLQEKLSPAVAQRVKAGYYLSRAELDAWHSALDERGWGASNWPTQYGGPGWTPMQKYIFEDECAQAGAPILIMMGLNQVAAQLRL
jgi:alkylation response protein AidB-like acyl-CoA dehydrogenase